MSTGSGKLPVDMEPSFKTRPVSALIVGEARRRAAEKFSSRRHGQPSTSLAASRPTRGEHKNVKYKKPGVLGLLVFQSLVFSRRAYGAASTAATEPTNAARRERHLFSSVFLRDSVSPW